MDLAEVRVFEQQVGTIKLSEAIRLGAKLRPQAFDMLFDGVGTCAMGAAHEALHGHHRYPKGGWDVWPGVTGAVVMEVVHRNNKLRQTREQIADWLQSIGL